MNWFIKLSESYTLNLIQEIHKVFPDRRFSMYHGSGSSEFVNFENEIYEIRVEPLKYARSFTNNKYPNLKAISILEKIKNSNILDKARDDFADMAIIGKYSPTDNSAYETSDRQEYKITVVHWKNSPYQNMVINYATKKS